MYSYLKEIRGYSVGKYHGGMEKEEREEAEQSVYDGASPMLHS